MSLARLALACSRRPWVVIAVWIAVVAGGVVSAPGLFERLTSETGRIEGSDSDLGAEAVDQAREYGPELYALLDGRPVSAPGYRENVLAVAARIEARPGVDDVRTAWDGGGPPAPEAVSRDGDATLVSVRFEPGPQGWAAFEETPALLQTIAAPRVVVGGGDRLDEEMEDQAAADLATAEAISTPLILLLLLILFGGVVAAGLPVLITLVGVGATLMLLYLISLVSDVSVYAINIVTMLGLGLAVDYALLLVARFREERAVDGSVPGGIERTYATAGRTVAFSGLTVAASLAALLAFPDVFLRSMGAAALGVVLLDLAAAVTLLPALLGLLGHRISASTRTDTGGWVFLRVARAVRRAPLAVFLVSASLLVLAAVPFLGVRFADPDERSLPSSSPSRQIVEAVDTRFSLADEVDPVTVVARGALAPEQLDPYLAQLAALPGVVSVSVRDGVPGLTVVDVVPSGTGQGDVARALVGAVRDLDAPTPVQVTGDAAELEDYLDALAGRAPWAFGVLFLTTFVLLFLFTGSVVLPLKAILLNLLSLGVTFGALVWVFQEGHLGGLVGTDALGALSVSTPVLVFAIAFGLSMDYEVFLLGRIAEIYRRTGSNDAAVEQGLRRTGGVITAAALLMAIVFGAFVAGGFSPVKQVGLGLVVAVLVDATIVRMLIVPAFMTLLGRANWWAPAPLRRLHDRLGLTDEPTSPGPANGLIVPATPALTGANAGSTDQ
jgi:RND superfamily putative drug exporter